MMGLCHTVILLDSCTLTCPGAESVLVRVLFTFYWNLAPNTNPEVPPWHQGCGGICYYWWGTYPCAVCRHAVCASPPRWWRWHYVKLAHLRPAAAQWKMFYATVPRIVPSAAAGGSHAGRSHQVILSGALLVNSARSAGRSLNFGIWWRGHHHHHI